VRLVDIPADEKLLELALTHNLAIYDATYLSLARSHNVPLVTVDVKLREAAGKVGVGLL
jgi:predicted nucleic acid-binding protein